MRVERIVAYAGLVVLSSTCLFGQDQPRTATVPHALSASGSGGSWLAGTTPDGRYLFFLSAARDLVPNDDLDGFINIYRYDTISGETRLVSAGRAGLGGGQGNSSGASVSSNGLVAFVSAAPDMVADDTNGSEDVFLRDLSRDSTRLVSVAISGGVPESPAPSLNRPLSANPFISPDGRYVGFESRATNLVSVLDTNNAYDVFVYDTQSNSVRAITLSFNRTAMANNFSRLAAISADGRKLAFVSMASDLIVDGPISGNEELYLHDLPTGETVCVSCGLQLPYPNLPAPTSTYRCFFPALSGDGSLVIFKAVAPGMSTAGVVLFETNVRSVLTINGDLTSPPRISADGTFRVYDNAFHIYRNAERISTNSAPNPRGRYPVISADASHIAYIADLIYDSPHPNSRAQIHVWDATTGTNRQITTAGSHDLSGLGIDPNGGYVAFDSVEDRLISDDRNSASDVFIFSLDMDETRLVSARADSLVPSTARSGNLPSRFSLSGDGQKLVFTSLDSDLVANDTNGLVDVFVRDLVSGAVVSLSDSNGVFHTNAISLDPMINGDGRYVTFRHGSDIVRRHLQSGLRDVVTSNMNVSSLAIRRIYYSPMSSDGRLVVYNYNNEFTLNSYVGLRDMLSGTNRTVSGPLPASAASPTPLLSPDESAVLHWNPNLQLALHDLATGSNTIIGPGTQTYAFSANSRYVIHGNARYDRLTRSNLFVCTSCANLTISGDGRLVAYEIISSTSRAIELRDLDSNITTLVSQNAYGTNGNGRSSSPVLSRDGVYLVFVSRASDLVPNDNNGTADLFVYDVRLKKLIRVTGQLPDGSVGAGPTSNPVFAPDGRTLAFQSFSARMVANDFDQQSEIFVMRLGPGDSDDDGLPDDWEVAYFGNLGQRAADDFDFDGHTNSQEYVSGTDPTNENSVLRVISVMSSSTGEVQLFWNAVPGKRYRVEYKNTLADAQWSSLPGLYTSGSAADPNASFGPAKFYRVVSVD